VPEDKDTLAIRELDAAVGDWMLKGVKLDRDSARFIRAALAYFFEKRAVFSWAGTTTRPTLYAGNTGFVNIELPEAQGNRGVHVVKFIPQSEYEKRSVILTDAAMALARFGYYRETKEKPKIGAIRRVKRTIWLSRASAIAGLVMRWRSWLSISATICRCC
jgi:hypothetical protein